MTNFAPLFKIYQGVRHCTACGLHKRRRLAVPGEGPAKAEIMFIGEAPGEKEDEVGLPFVGPSGKFLELMLEEAGLDIKSVYITSTVKCRPPLNRRPKEDEVSTCSALWLKNQIRLVNPRLVVLMGETALSVFCAGATLPEMRGQLFKQAGRLFFVTYHPSAARRFPSIKSKTRHDFSLLKRIIGDW